MDLTIYFIVAAVIGWVATEIMRDRLNRLAAVKSIRRGRTR